YKRPEKTVPRVKEHHWDWLQAIRNGTKAGSDFAAYGGPLTEIALLGVIAIRMAGTKLKWDATRLRFVNSKEANQLLNPPYRTGWKLGGLGRRGRTAPDAEKNQSVAFFPVAWQ